MLSRVCIIVAGGGGKRMGGSVPKQFMPICGMPILMRTIMRFKEFDADIHIVLVLPEKDMPLWYQLCDDYSFNVECTVVAGGSERFLSVKNALTHVSPGVVVGVHDGVRPFVSVDTIARCYAVAEQGKNVVPCVALSDSIREISGDASRSMNRNNYRAVQTPQVFPSEVLLSAYDREFSEAFTDDASVVEAAGGEITLVDGNVENIKITNPFDMIIAERLIHY